MIIGTSHFTSLAAAYRYYAAQNDDHAPVDRKIIEGQIHIGSPVVKEGQRLTVIDGGTRYAIVEGAK